MKEKIIKIIEEMQKHIGTREGFGETLGLDEPFNNSYVLLHVKPMLKNFLTTAMQRAYEAGREHWLRSEIEKLEKEIRIADGVPDALTYVWQHGHNKVLTSIITRYKEELLELEKGV